MSLLDSGRPNVAQVLLSRLSQSDLKVWLQNYAQPYKELMAYYRCAMMAVSTKFEILNEEFSLQYDRNPIEGIKTRLKSPESSVITGRVFCCVEQRYAARGQAGLACFLPIGENGLLFGLRRS